MLARTRAPRSALATARTDIGDPSRQTAPGWPARHPRRARAPHPTSTAEAKHGQWHPPGEGWPPRRPAPPTHPFQLGARVPGGGPIPSPRAVGHRIGHRGRSSGASVSSSGGPADTKAPPNRDALCRAGRHPLAPAGQPDAQNNGHAIDSSSPARSPGSRGRPPLTVASRHPRRHRRGAACQAGWTQSLAPPRPSLGAIIRCAAVDDGAQCRAFGDIAPPLKLRGGLCPVHPDR